MNITICDDEKKFADKIKKLCKKVLKEQKIRDTQILYEPSGESFLSSVQETDILILDIEMDVVTGIEVKQRLKEQNLETKIIFLTSHQEWMKEAFGKYVYGFVNKENYEELREILVEVIEEIEQEKDFIIVDEGRKKKKLKLKDIIYVKASGGYLEFYTENHQYLKREKISTCEIELVRKGFCRIHKSYMINLNYMKSVDKEKVVMAGDRHLPISRGISKNIKLAYIEFLEKKK